MNKGNSYIFLLFIILLLFSSKDAKSIYLFTDTSITDTTLSYPFPSNQYGGLYMNFPKDFSKEVIYDEDTDKYILYQRVGKTVVFSKNNDFQEYLDYQLEEMMKNHWILEPGIDKHQPNRVMEHQIICWRKL